MLVGLLQSAQAYSEDAVYLEVWVVPGGPEDLQDSQSERCVIAEFDLAKKGVPRSYSLPRSRTVGQLEASCIHAAEVLR